MELFMKEGEDKNVRVCGSQVHEALRRFDVPTLRALVLTTWTDRDVRKALDDGPSSLRGISPPLWSSDGATLGHYMVAGDDLVLVIMGNMKSYCPMSPDYHAILSGAPIEYRRLVLLCTHELKDAQDHPRILAIDARELLHLFAAAVRCGRAVAIIDTLTSTLGKYKPAVVLNKTDTRSKTHPRLSSVQHVASQGASSPRTKASSMKPPKARATYAAVVTRRDVAGGKATLPLLNRRPTAPLLTSADEAVARQYKATLDLIRACPRPSARPFFVDILKHLQSDRHEALQEPKISYTDVEEYVDAWQPLLVAEVAHAIRQGFKKNATLSAILLQKGLHGDVWRFILKPWTKPAPLHIHDVVRLTSGRTEYFGVVVGQDQVDHACFNFILEDGACPRAETKWSVVVGANIKSNVREHSALVSLGQVPATLRRMILDPTHAASVRCTVKKCDASLRKLHSTPGSAADTSALDILSHLDDTAMTLGEFFSTRILATVQDLSACSNKAVAEAARALSNKWLAAIELETATNSPPRFVSVGVWDDVSSGLDMGQRVAIKEMLDSRDPIALLQGPPGTGKTTASVALANLPQQTAATRFGRLPVLITAPSNKAAFGFATRLTKPHCLVDTDGNRTTIVTPSAVPAPQVFTLGINAKADVVPDELKKYCFECVIDNAMKASSRVSLLRHRRETAVNRHKELNVAIKSSTYNKKRELYYERDALSDNIKELTDTMERVRLEKTKTIVGNTTFIVGTLSSLGNGTLDVVDHGFAAIIVDEAAQAVELSILLACSVRACRHFYIGDPQQLEATVLAKEVKLAKYGRSLFKRLEDADVPVSMLQIQYRMHPLIAHFSSTNFYDGSLKSGRAVFARLRDNRIYNHPTLQPFMFYDVRGDECAANGSFYNNAEAVFITDMVRHIKTVQAGATWSYAILSPYKGQVELLRKNVAAEKWTEVQVNTIDAFQAIQHFPLAHIFLIVVPKQGQEADIVLLSPVRTTSPGFLTEEPRANVALTRSRSNTIVVGHAALLKTCTIWSKAMKHAYKLKAYFTASGKPFSKIWDATEADTTLKTHQAKMHKVLLEMSEAVPDGCVGLRSLDAIPHLRAPTRVA